MHNASGTALMAMAVAVALAGPATAIRPAHSWDTLGTMSFFHACNESGPFSDRALDTITKFPLVTIEKGQGFRDTDCTKYGAPSAPCAEEKIIQQCAAVKKRNGSIATVFYYNAVLSWYFYHMDVVMHASPQFALNDSFSHKPVLAPGDKTFNPPKAGMLVFDHSSAGLREYWKSVCINATQTGFVDGCFSDSSQASSHGTSRHLNAADNAAYEAGKIQTMTELTEFFGGEAGQPYAGSHGVVIGKAVNQSGINAMMIEMFRATEDGIVELMEAAAKGWLVQAHASVDTKPSTAGCNDLTAMTDLAAAFLIGAGDDSYFGSGPWISPGIGDVEQRWCPALMERPLGRPLALATKTGTVWERNFTSGTRVRFDTRVNSGAISWGA